MIATGVNILPNKWMLHPGKIMKVSGRIYVVAWTNRDFSKTFPNFSKNFTKFPKRYPKIFSNSLQIFLSLDLLFHINCFNGLQWPEMAWILIFVRYFPCTFTISGQESLDMENLDRIGKYFELFFGISGKFWEICH